MNSQLKDFGWYNNVKSSSDSKVQNQVIKPAITTRIYEEKRSLNQHQQRPYDHIVKNINQSERVQEPTIINIESKVYSPAPIKVISVQHSDAYKQAHNGHVYNNPLFEPRLSTNIDVAATEHPSNTYTKSSLTEETEPLLDHADSHYDFPVKEDIEAVEDMGITEEKFLQNENVDVVDSTDKGDYKEEEDIYHSTSDSTLTLDSSLNVMKSNSMKLEALDLAGPSDSGVVFDNGLADLVDLEYKGDYDNAYSEDIITDNEKWKNYYSRRSPQFIIQLEEQERMERMARGMNPVLLGMWHRVQKDFMASRGSFFPSESVSNTISKLGETISETTDKALESVIETKDEVKETMQETFSAESAYLLTSGISGMLHSVAETAHNLVDTAKASVGFYPKGSYPAIAALEEKERLSRMNKKVDPLLDAKKKHFERELIDHVKKAC